MRNSASQKPARWYKSPPLICAFIAIAIMVIALAVVVINGAITGFNPTTRAEYWTQELSQYTVLGAVIVFGIGVILYIRQSILRATDNGKKAPRGKRI